MNREEALELLQHHSFTHPDYKHAKSEKGHLGMLRPFTGLYDENFHELMHILKVLAHDFQQEKLEREIISNFWGICQLSRAWGVEEGGMLRKNKLITPEQINKLSDWTDCISYTVLCLLDNQGEEESFSLYHLEYPQE